MCIISAIRNIKTSDRVIETEWNNNVDMIKKDVDTYFIQVGYWIRMVDYKISLHLWKALFCKKLRDVQQQAKGTSFCKS